MAINKKEEFSKEEQQLAVFANALSHPARIAILKAIAQRKTCICGEIVEVLPLAQSTVSQHLKELLKVDLIQGTIDGAKSCYCINWSVFNQFADAIKQFSDEMKSNLNDNSNSCC